MSRLLEQPLNGSTYAAAGVSIEAGDEAVERIKDIVKSTKRSEVLGGIGGFGGLFALDTSKYTAPVLVASADGVGTKLDIARQVGRYDSVGIDLVAMLVDDLACVGAEPLFLLDYVAVGKLDPDRLEELVAGIAEGCRQAKTALLGGETAEHAGVMAPDDLDVAGFAVGVVERSLQHQHPTGVNSPQWTGFFRLEYGLWHGQSLASLVPGPRGTAVDPPAASASCEPPGRAGPGRWP